MEGEHLLNVKNKKHILIYNIQDDMDGATGDIAMNSCNCIYVIRSKIYEYQHHNSFYIVASDVVHLLFSFAMISARSKQSEISIFIPDATIRNSRMLIESIGAISGADDEGGAG